MSTALLWMVTGLYLIQCGVSVHNGQHPQAMILIGYVVANVGLIWSMQMTRINLVPPSELCDRHLIAEYRELPRVFALARPCADAPVTYCLGKGHVKFFYDKLRFLYRRQVVLYREMLSRGFKPSFDPLYIFDDLVSEYVHGGLWNDYTPSQAEIDINKARIAERLADMVERGVSVKVTEMQP